MKKPTAKRPRNKWVSDSFPHEVYFVRAVGLDAIKIGYASDARARFRSIATCCPVECELIGTISSHEAADVERAWHRRYRLLRIRGEWYRETPELVAAIAEAAKEPRADEEAVYAALVATYGTGRSPDAP